MYRERLDYQTYSAEVTPKQNESGELQHRTAENFCREVRDPIRVRLRQWVSPVVPAAILEHEAGIEPAHRCFADSHLTT